MYDTPAEFSQDEPPLPPKNPEMSGIMQKLRARQPDGPEAEPLDDLAVDVPPETPVVAPAPAAKAWVLPDELLRTDLTNFEAAQALAGVFRIVPTSTAGSHSKHPGGLLKKDWPKKASQDPAVLATWFVFRLHQPPTKDAFWQQVPLDTLGLMAVIGPDVVAIDIDDPSAVPEHMWPALDAAVFQSSSSRDPRRGHYIFLKPDGYRFSNSAIKGTHGKDTPGDIRHGNGVIASAPSQHTYANRGRRYQWIRVGEIRPMPTHIAEWCKSATQTTTFNGKVIESTSAGLDGLEEFANTATAASHPHLLDEQIDYLHHMAYHGTGAIHIQTINIAINTLAFAAHDYYTGKDAIDALVDEFVAIRTDPSSRRNQTDPEAAEKEILGICAWALGRVNAHAAEDPDGYAWHVANQAAAWYGIQVTATKPPDYAETSTPAPSVGPATAKIKYPATDNGHAHMFMDRTTDNLLGLALGDGKDTTQWLRWNDTTNMWEQRATEHLYEVVQRQLADLYRESATEYDAAAATAEATDADLAKELTKTAKQQRATAHKLGNTGPQKSLLTQAHPLRQATLDDFDQIADTPQYPARNGKLVFTNPDGTLRTPQTVLEPFTRSDRILTTGAVDYDPDAESAILDGYLNVFHPDPTERRRLQKAMGYTLLDGNPAKKILLATGPGDSGKTTLIEAMAAMHGGLGGSFAVAMFSDAEQSDPRNPALYRALPKRFLGTTEASSAQVMHAEVVKKLTGNDSMSARENYNNDVRSRVPGFTLMIGTNEFPQIPKLDAPTLNRFMVLAFDISHRDPTATPLKNDPQALRALLRWCVDGLLMYLDEGFTTAELTAHRERLTAAATLEGYVLSMHLIAEPGACAPLEYLWPALATYSARNPWGLSLHGGPKRDLPTETQWRKGGYLQANGYETKKLTQSQADLLTEGRRNQAITGYRLATPDEVYDAENGTDED